MISTFHYFAYGSNMLTARLRARCQSAQPVGVGVARGYAVVFQKRGTDDSAKATLSASCGSNAFGVIFEIPESERRHLDLAEGAGYAAVEEFSVERFPTVYEDSGETRSTTTYVVAADWQTPNLQPYHWYKALVVHGAVEHGLPVEHINLLLAVPSVADPWADRPGLVAARTALGARNVNTWPVVRDCE